MNQAILIATTPGDLETGEPSPWLPPLLASLKGCSYRIHVVETWRYELTAIRKFLDSDGADEFVFLPHSMIVTDNGIWDVVFKERKGESVSLCQTPVPFGMYLGKYRRSVILRNYLPTVETKVEAVRNETMWTKGYAANDHWSALGDLPHTEVFEEKNGRLNMVTENKWFKKWKGSWDSETMLSAMNSKAG